VGAPGRRRVFDGSAWHLYRNGTLAASAPDTTGPVNVQANWAIGASSSGDRFFYGVIDEVRIWNIARSASDIAAGLTQPVTGHEPGLVGFWRPGLPGNFHYSDQPPATQAWVQGSPTPVPGPFPSFTALFGVDSQLVASADAYAMPADAWSHIAAMFHQAYGVQVNATAGTAAYLDCGNDESLDLVGDLTIEVGARLDDLASPQALVGRGASSSDDPGMPYSLAVDTSGRLMFGFADSSGQSYSTSSTGTVSAGTFHRLAVTRSRSTTVIGAAIAGTENGLVSWWRFTENAGSTTADAKSNNTATRYGSVRWTATPDPDGSHLVVCQDGVPVSTTPQSAGTFGAQFTLGALEQATSGEFLQGELTEVRVWRTARTVAEIQDNLFSRLSGEFEDLLAYYRFDIGDDTVVSDSGPRGQDLVAGPGCVPVVSTAPLGDDIPQVRDALTGLLRARRPRHPGDVHPARDLRAPPGGQKRTAVRTLRHHRHRQCSCPPTANATASSPRHGMTHATRGRRRAQVPVPGQQLGQPPAGIPAPVRLEPGRANYPFSLADSSAPGSWPGPGRRRPAGLGALGRRLARCDECGHGRAVAVTAPATAAGGRSRAAAAGGLPGPWDD
jgi:Concanavalin A-like lectin/glucanases superfamily